MPHLTVNSPTGDVDFYYNVATPTLPSSPVVDADLPNVLFIHGEYVPQEIFEAQFSDPQLRNRFNLIAVDLRGFGATGGFVPKGTYTPAHAAQDLYLFLKTLQISKVHIFAVSISTHVALELAGAHPDLVDSLTLCSTLPPEEPEDVVAGRLELFDFWHDSQPQESGSTRSDGDQDLESTLLRGAQQMLFSERSTSLSEAVSMVALEYDSTIWAGTLEAQITARVLCVDWFLERRVFDVESLSKIRCPVTIIHCEEDIAYPSRHAHEFEAQLRQAGNTRVTLRQVPGPRFANVIYPEIINPIIRDLVLSVTEPNNRPGAVSSKAKKSSQLVTPFKEALAHYGYHSDSSDEDSD